MRRMWVFSLVCWLAVPGLLAAENAAGVSLEEAAQSACKLPRLKSLLASWRGELVLEKYCNGARAGRSANVKSVSKSVISALVGIAIDRGLIESVQTPIAEFFPELLGENTDPRKSRITVEDLLTMRSGLERTSGRNYGAWVQSGNWVNYALTRRMLSEPGTEMDYSTGNTHLLSAILTRASGSSTWAFAQETLAEPLGISLARWQRDPQGVYFGGNNMTMTPRQMLAFGELYLRRGRANGKQIVPEAWVDASFVPRGRSYWSDELYGYGWWIGELDGTPAYFAWGYGGQFIFVVPELDLVIVTTSSEAGGRGRHSHKDELRDLVERRVVEPIKRASR